MDLCIVAECHTEDGHIQAVTDGWPNPCSFFAVLINGYEDAYWISDEWKEEPELVMGAILGVIKTIVDNSYTPDRNEELRISLGKFDGSKA
jgi:hypothetical protein